MVVFFSDERINFFEKATKVSLLIIYVLQQVNSEVSKVVTSESLFAVIKNSTSCTRMFSYSTAVDYEWNTTILVGRELWTPSYVIF